MEIGILGVKTYPAFAGADRVVESLLQNFDNGKNTYSLYLTTVDNKLRLKDEQGLHFIYLPTIRSKHFKAFVFFLFTTFHVLFKGRYDVVHVHNSDFGFFIPILRFKRSLKIIGTFHGNPYERAKWGWGAKLYFRISEFFFIRFCHYLTTVAESKLSDVPRKYRNRIVYIPNGINTNPRINTSFNLKELGVERGKYFLFACGRLDKTKGLHHLLTAYNSGDFEEPLLIIGDFSHDPQYAATILNFAKQNKKIIIKTLLFPKEDLFFVLQNARVFIFPSEIEAMSMILLEAIMLKVPVVCSNIPENRAIVGNDYKYLFTSSNSNMLGEKLKDFIQDNTHEQQTLKLYQKACLLFNWHTIAKQYEDIYKKIGE